MELHCFLFMQPSYMAHYQPTESYAASPFEHLAATRSGEGCFPLTQTITTTTTAAAPAAPLLYAQDSHIAYKRHGYLPQQQQPCEFGSSGFTTETSSSFGEGPESGVVTREEDCVQNHLDMN